VIEEIEAIAGAIRGDRPPPGPPPAAGDSPGARVMTKALAAAVDLVAGKRPATPGPRCAGRRCVRGSGTHSTRPQAAGWPGSSHCG
jgi:hypothetical protein